MGGIASSAQEAGEAARAFIIAAGAAIAEGVARGIIPVDDVRSLKAIGGTAISGAHCRAVGAATVVEGSWYTTNTEAND